MRCFLILFSLLVSLVMTEFGLRQFFAVKIDYDIEMWRYARLLKEPVEDLRSHVHRPNSRANIMGVDMRINAQGFRDDDLIARQAPWLAIGDSFTLGFGVPKEKTFVDLFEKKTGHEIINAGVGNYNLEQEIAFWQIKGKDIRPQRVFWFLYVNDGEPTQRATWATDFYLFAFLKSVFIKVHALSFPEQDYVHTYQGLYSETMWPKFESQLAKLTEVPNLTVIILSDLRNLKDYPFKEFHEKVQAFLKTKNISVIDTLPVFLGQDETKLWVAPDDPHPNILGHSLIAELLYKETKL